MTFKKCRNEGCEVQIEVRNTAEGWRPFEENGSKHNCQFSDYAKKQRGVQQGEVIHGRYDDEEKNDHGNELVEPLRLKNPENIGNATIKYVDHTLTPELQLEIFTDPTPEGLKLSYNRFTKEHKIRYSQSHVLGSQYTVYVWYEESK